MMKRLFISLMIFNLLCSPVLALNFDLSADDEIRKEYNPSKLEDDVGLPPLPKILNDEEKSEMPVNTQNVNASKANAQVIKQTQSINLQRAKAIVEQESSTNAPESNFSNSTSNRPGMGSYAVLHKGTKFYVEILNTISDKTRRGATVKMVSLYPVTTTYLTIPTGTVFYGKITDSHRPQFGNNGGLIVIKIYSMILNGETQSINAKVIKVNSKHIFYNNVKGQRGYFRSMYKSTALGRHFGGKMLRVTKNLASDGSSIILTPFSLILGVSVWGANTMASPAIALLHKGYHIDIPAGSRLRIKLNQDIIIYN